MASPTAHGATRVVFLDPTGRRWRWARWGGLAVAVGVLVALCVAVPAVMRQPLHPRGGAGVSAEAVGAHPASFGEGPLVRVVRIARDGGFTDPFTGARLGRLTRDEHDSIGARTRYAVQYYGYAPQPGRPSMALTFDDGPSAEWTPEVLDLLSSFHAQATFYDVGENVARYPELVQRERREGHLVGNHSTTHPDLGDAPGWKQDWELVTTDRAIRAVTGRGDAYVRLPYDGGTGLQFVRALLSAQRQGYVEASYDYDSTDWDHVGDPAAIPLPKLHGQDITVLLHDAGGDRSATLVYLRRLLAQAQAHGYTFTTVATATPTAQEAVAQAAPSTVWDQLSLVELKLLYVWPADVLQALFVLAVVSVALVGLAQLVLAALRHRRRRQVLVLLDHEEPVDVVIAAYNEEAVIARTLGSVLASTQRLGRVIVVDDGSSDRTADEVRAVAARDPRVVLVSQANGGKSSALNHGLRLATSEVVATLDADTVLLPHTIASLARPFASSTAGDLGAVAGTVKVGNRTRNLLTRWQALEYLAQIGVERASQDAMGAISIIPGACAAWRRSAVLAAGGYSHDTLAEDCDLSLTLHELGYRITQDEEAVALTEAPDTVDALLAQRSRWMYGTMQAVVKHRSMIFNRRFGWLGLFVLPAYVLSIVVPLVFLPVVGFMTYQLVSQDGYSTVLPYLLSFLAVQAMISVAGVWMMGERARTHLWVVPLYRGVFEPLRAYLLYTSAHTALKGAGLGWNKLKRTGILDGLPHGTAVPVTTGRTELVSTSKGLAS